MYQLRTYGFGIGPSSHSSFACSTVRGNVPASITSTPGLRSRTHLANPNRESAGHFNISENYVYDCLLV